MRFIRYATDAGLSWGVVDGELVRGIAGSPSADPGAELLPGDVVLTGTPDGVAPVAIGQTVVVEIEGIGALSNRVVPEPDVRR
jgi:hypothetical protein